MRNDPPLPTLLLSAGHHVHDPGAVYDGVHEHDVAKGIAWYTLGAIADENAIGDGMPTVVVPSMKLSSKIFWVNEWKKIHKVPCFAVELHCDAFRDVNVRGMTVFHYPDQGKSLQHPMALEILRTVTRPTWPSRGRKRPNQSAHGTLGWVEKTTMPSFLIEMGFLSNPEQRAVLASAKGQEMLGHRLGSGLINAAIHMHAVANTDKPGGRLMARGTFNKEEWREHDARGTLGDDHKDVVR